MKTLGKRKSKNNLRIVTRGSACFNLCSCHSVSSTKSAYTASQASGWN